MLFKTTFLLSLAVSALAHPAPKKHKVTATTAIATEASATAASATAASATEASATAVSAASATGGSVLTVQDYADFQISDGVAGNALDEVNAKFPIDQTNLAGVSADDLAILKAARVTAEAAETDAGGFNDAIDAAGGDSSTAGKPLQVGKIKNKVLKLQLEVLALQIDQAQSGTDNSDKIAEETTKLNNNIALDAAAAGETSQSVDFQGDDSP